MNFVASFAVPLLLLALASPLVASAEIGPIEIIHRSEQSFVNSGANSGANSGCAATASCDLKGAALVREDYRFWFHDRFHSGTRVFAKYETDGVEKLESYAFVQKIRGCHYSSWIGADGKLQKVLDVSRKYFDDYRAFSHPKWMIDSDDFDAMYNSDARPGKNRHGIYRWNEVAGSYDPKTEKLYSVAEPVRAELYVSDRPGQAWLDPEKNVAKNISLQFEMCIYKTSEIPTVATPEGVDFAEPLHCFPWASSFIYDFGKKAFESQAEIDSYCLGQ